MTKYRVKRLPNVIGKLDFEWEVVGNSKDAKWDWNKIETEVKSMKVGEEKIVTIEL